MTYLLLICIAENVQLTSEQSAAMGPATESWVAETDRRGVRREGSGLRPVREATTVRVRDGGVLVSDGPFAETKEQIAGFYIVDCADLDEAIAVASQLPAAHSGTIEVRPVWES